MREEEMKITSRLDANSVLKMMLGLTAAVVAPSACITVITIAVLAFELLSGNNIHAPIPPNTQTDVAFQLKYLFAIAFFVGFWALLIAAMHVGILGFPAAIVGQYLKLVRWWSSILVGFSLGCLPLAGFELLKGKGSSEYAGAVALVVDGVRTTAGWIKFGKEISIMGFFGATGGLAFWLTWRFMTRFDSSIQDS
jgi:hypothetical protein